MKCPGQDSRYWGPEAIFEATCPGCGARIEFFKDESSRRCRKCGHKVLNPKMDFGCAAYCRFADQCMGDLPPELLAKRSDLLKDRVAAEVKKALGLDFKRIGKTLKIVEYAEELLRAEGADSASVILAAYLSAVPEGPENEKSAEGSSSGNIESAGAILARAGAPAGLSAEVQGILKSLKTGRVEQSAASMCVHDAIRLAEIQEGLSDQSAGMTEVVESLLTQSGRAIASGLFLEKLSGDQPAADA